jgi:hypothetical protein
MLEAARKISDEEAKTLAVELADLVAQEQAIKMAIIRDKTILSSVHWRMAEIISRLTTYRLQK